MARTSASPRRQRRWVDRVGLIGVLAPVAIWLLAVLITLSLGRYGCQIDEGSAHPCSVFGQDLSDFAYNAGFFAAWGPLFLWPISVGFAMLWGLTRLLLLALPKPSGEPTTKDS